MYKVIYNDVVIDLLKTVRYGKYIPATKRVIATNKSTANCIVASNLKDRYLLRGVPTPEGCPYIKVSLVPITDEEYYTLLGKEESPFESGIKKLRETNKNIITITANKPITKVRYGYTCIMTEEIKKDVSKMVSVYDENNFPLDLFIISKE